MPSPSFFFFLRLPPPPIREVAWVCVDSGEAHTSAVAANRGAVRGKPGKGRGGWGAVPFCQSGLVVVSKKRKAVGRRGHGRGPTREKEVANGSSTVDAHTTPVPEFSLFLFLFLNWCRVAGGQKRSSSLVPHAPARNRSRSMRLMTSSSTQMLKRSYFLP